MQEIKLIAPNDQEITGYITSDGEVLPITCKFQRAGGQNHFFYELPKERYGLDIQKGGDIVLVDSTGKRWTGMDVQESTLRLGRT